MVLTLGNSTKTADVNGAGKRPRPMAVLLVLRRKDTKVRPTAKLTLAEWGGADSLFDEFSRKAVAGYSLAAAFLLLSGSSCTSRFNVGSSGVKPGGSQGASVVDARMKIPVNTSQTRFHPL